MMQIEGCARHLYRTPFPYNAALVILILVFASSGGCSVASDSGSAFRIYDENGVAIAETTGGPRFEEPLFTYEVEIILKEDPERPESMLFRPGSIHMDDNGMFFVIDRGDGRVVVYDRQGEYVRSFGRKGDGPGEFQGMNMLRLAGNVMTIFDYTLQRTTRYGTDGTLLEVYRAPGSAARGGSFERLEDEGFVTWPSPDYTDEPEHPVISSGCERIVMTDASGDTLCDLITQWVPWGYSYQLERGGGTHRMEFVGYPQLLFFPGRGILESTGIEPVLTWFNIRGQVVEEIHLRLDPIPVTAEDRARVRQRAMDEYELRKEQSPDHAKAVLDVLRIPDEKAYWDNVFLDDAGFYWLHVPEEYEVKQEKGGALCRVLSPEGEYLGHSRWPLTFGTFKNGHFLGLVYDEETGEVVPTIYRIIPAVEGLVYP